MWVPACVPAMHLSVCWRWGSCMFVCVAVCVSLHLGCGTWNFCRSFALICSFAINARVKKLRKIVLCQLCNQYKPTAAIGWRNPGAVGRGGIAPSF